MRLSPKLFKRLSADCRGATVVEYAFILAGIALAIFGAMQSLGGATGGMWNDVSTKVINAH